MNKTDTKALAGLIYAVNSALDIYNKLPLPDDAPAEHNYIALGSWLNHIAQQLQQSDVTGSLTYQDPIT